MPTYEFEKQYNDEFGSYGWLIRGAPSTYFPILGMGVAHDILEHQPGDNGTVEEELMALGAALYIRGNGNYWRGSRIPPGGHLSGELSNDLAFKYGGVDDGIASPGRTYKLEDFAEEWIAQALEGTKKEFEYHAQYYSNELREYRANTKDYLKKVPGWLRIGYRKAKRRYSKVAPWDLCTIFSKIEKDSDKYIDMAEDGDLFVVQLDTNRLECTTRLESKYDSMEWEDEDE